MTNSRSPRRRLLVVAVLAALVGCTGAGDEGVQATSLLGRSLRTPELDPEVRVEREALLAESRHAYDLAPDDETAIVWYGRRTAYLGRYRAAIDVYTTGLGRRPDSVRLRRHRGHRYLTVRELDRAVGDLTEAATLSAGVPNTVEPDGLPNRLGLPRSTTHGNVFYHLGLAHYVRGDFEPALASYRQALALADNDDTRCATSYWLYLTLRRLGRDAEAAAVLTPIRGDMDVIENTTYQNLLLLYKGEREPADLHPDTDAAVGADIDDATLAYGLAMWDRLHRREDEARAAFRRIVAGPAWPAFGHLAAEAELARLER